MSERTETVPDLEGFGQAVARAIGAGEEPGIETRRARAAAKAALFGTQTEATKVDRYLVIELLGAGAMGSVYAAYDPKLDRKVALKLLAPDRAAPSRDLAASGAGSDALLGEAQALAQVRHPNVVQVYDAGIFGDRVYLTMELIEGETLRAWLGRRRSEPWEVVLRMSMQAGRGLAAVHAAGLVHRDFKPDNVLIGRDGVARVADFGLARAEDTDGLAATRAARLGSQTPQTTGAGTPAYLAPERLQGQPADARSDLYSFCVTLFEGLAGARPYADIAIISGDFSASTRGDLPPTLPAWLVRVLERGLDPDPGKRPASMDALLGELEAGLEADAVRRRRRAGMRRLALTSAAAIAIVAGLYGAQRIDEGTRVSKCEAAATDVDAVWPARENEVTAGIRSSGLVYAEDTATRIGPRLEQWARQWGEARRSSCLAATVEGTLPTSLLPRATGCLELRRAEVDALLDLIASGDADAIQHGVTAVAGLPPVDACADRAFLEHGTWPEAARWNEVLAARRQLTDVTSLEWVGKYQQAVPKAQAVLETARGLGWEPLVAMTQIQLGSLHYQLGSYDAAAADLTEAFFTARRAGADDLAGDAASRLAGTVGARLAQPEAGRLWARHAQVLLEAAQASPREWALLDRSRGGIEAAAFRMEEAERLYGGALAQLEETLGPEHPLVVITLDGYAAIRSRMGALDEAKAIHERVLALHERNLGPRHPEVAAALLNLAADHMRLGDNAGAVPLLERSIAVLEAARGPDHPDLALALENLGQVREADGDAAAARALYQRSLDIAERSLGPDHPRIARTLGNLASTFYLQGENEKAIEYFERGHSLLEKAYGPEHPEVAAALSNLAIVHQQLGHLELALELLRRSLPSLEKSLGAEHLQVAPTLCTLGDLSLELDRPADAVGYFERCLSIYDAHEGAQPNEPLARFRLARSLMKAGRDRARAVGLARRALEQIEAQAQPDGEHEQEIEAFLAEHGRDGSL